MGNKESSAKSKETEASCHTHNNDVHVPKELKAKPFDIPLSDTFQVGDNIIWIGKTID